MKVERRVRPRPELRPEHQSAIIRERLRLTEQADRERLRAHHPDSPRFKPTLPRLAFMERGDGLPEKPTGLFAAQPRRTMRGV